MYIMHICTLVVNTYTHTYRCRHKPTRIYTDTHIHTHTHTLYIYIYINSVYILFHMLILFWFEFQHRKTCLRVFLKTKKKIRNLIKKKWSLKSIILRSVKVLITKTCFRKCHLSLRMTSLYTKIITAVHIWLWFIVSWFSELNVRIFQHIFEDLLLGYCKDR